MNEYRMRFDDAHLQEALVHIRRTSSAKAWQLAVKWICAFGLVVLLAVTVWVAFERPKVLVVALVPLFFLLLLVLSSRISLWLTKRRFRSSPVFGRELFVSVEERGVSLIAHEGRSELPWSAVARATRFPAGFLVWLGPNSPHWWPNTALVAGNLGHVARLLRVHARNYRSYVA